MPEFIQNGEWDDYRDIINKFHNDAFQQTITWRKKTNSNNIHGEDTIEKTTDIQLKCLVSYNDYRSWPVTVPSNSGFIDAQSLLIYLNTKYLTDNNFTNANGFLNLDPIRDRFILKGRVYIAMGESDTAQANDDPLLQFLILKREEKKNS